MRHQKRKQVKYRAVTTTFGDATEDIHYLPVTIQVD